MSKKPNVIFIFSDQQRWDSMGCYGQELNITPNLDKMAAEGVKFNNAFTCQPVCGPARACIQTGKWATEMGCFRNDKKLPANELTLAHYFTEAGYETGYLGKWHLASEGVDHNYRTKAVPPHLRGGYNDYWLASDVLEFTSHGYNGYMYDGDMNKVEFTGYRVDCQTDFVLDYLDTRDGEKPFYLFLSYIEPHHQNDHNRYEGPYGSKEKYADYKVPGDLVGTGGDWRENYPDYLGCCASLDYNVGRIREKLNDLNLTDDTVIIYTSDHGSHFCTRNSEYKRACHDGCTHIPMIAYGPGFLGGIEIDDMVSLLDTTPTLLKCAGIDTPSYMGGNAMQKLVEGDADDWPSEIFMQISESQVGRAIRNHKWKYSVTAPDKNGNDDADSMVYVEDFLYDLEADPHERNNLVSNPAYADVRAELKDTLIKRMVMANEAEPEIVPAS